MAQRWTEVTIEVARAHADAVANFLVDCGAPGLQWADEGDTARLTAYFTDSPPIDALLRYCRDLGDTTGHAVESRVATRPVDDEDWANSWRRHSQPQIVGERFYIAPSWAADPPQGRIAVIIDPGMAFGTGQHASTRGCLEALEWSAVRALPHRALDVGTGSGVLAIALAKLGVREVWAVDTDPIACTVAAANAAANAVSAQIRVVPELAAVPGSFDLLVANLYADLLEALAQALRRRLHPHGVLIASGFLSADEDRVRAAYASHGLDVVRRHIEAPWVTLQLQARAAP